MWEILQMYILAKERTVDTTFGFKYINKWIIHFCSNHLFLHQFIILKNANYEKAVPLVQMHFGIFTFLLGVKHSLKSFCGIFLIILKLWNGEVQTYLNLIVQKHDYDFSTWCKMLQIFLEQSGVNWIRNRPKSHF